jgi:hypothetical protein
MKSRNYFNQNILLILSVTFGLMTANFLIPGKSYAIDPTVNHHMTLCKDSSDSNCIETITATTPDGQKIDAIHIGNLGSTDSPLEIWKLPGVKFENGENQFIVNMDWRRDGEQLCWADTPNCSYHSGSIDLIFYPYGPNISLPPIHFKHDSTDLQCGTTSNPLMCGMWLNFGVELQWEMTFRITNFHPGMLSGRSKQAQLIDLDPQLSILNSHRFRLVGTNYMQDTNIVNEVRNSSPGNRNYADARSDGYIVWIWDSNNDALTRFPQQCMPNSIPGPISHFMFNTYNIGNPTWDPNTSTLSVNVESPHFSVDGSLASGYYEMFFPVSVAKCLWNIKDLATANATVSITDSNGAIDVATISQQNDQAGFSVIAANFHFSNPTIRVSFAPSNSSKNESPNLPRLVPPKKINQIFCVKGISKVRISATKCPSGFKKA